MNRYSLGSGGLLLALLSAAWCLGSGGGADDPPKATPPVPQIKADQQKAATPAQPEDQVRPAIGPPHPEDQLSAQELTDQFLVVRARFVKPEMVPVYELGEQIVLELDIRNMSERHQFLVPSWVGADAGSNNMASHYLVEARRSGKPAPLTVFGQRAVELFERNLPVKARNTTFPFQGDAHPRGVVGQSTIMPTQAKIMVNVLCDMTDAGEYELIVKFRVGAWMEVNGRGEAVNAIKVVSPSPPLRLNIVNRLEKHLPPPVNTMFNLH